MIHLVILFAALVANGVCSPVVLDTKVANERVLVERQLKLMYLFFHPHEPIHIPEQKAIAASWSIEGNVQNYNNISAVKEYVIMFKNGWTLPRSVPFAVHNPVHIFEAETLFHVLFSAKDYDTFYKTAVYLRNHVNEGLYVYALSIAILHRPDTQGIFIPPIYEVFPALFNNGEVINIAQRINTHRKKMVEHYPSTYLWEDNVVIKQNETIYNCVSNKNARLAYYLQDYGLNSFYYYVNLLFPNWLSGKFVVPPMENRGVWFWFGHKQLVARYYMERLSNDLGEIPELGLDTVEEGNSIGAMYHNGVPFPVRPKYFILKQPAFIEAITQIIDFESRIRDGIQHGYFIDTAGERAIPISSPRALNILGSLVQGNVDSPNLNYYKDFVSIWKALLGNSVVKQHQYHNGYVPLVVPSLLENHETTLRDPAFYMIWKRVLNLFSLWLSQLPYYKPEELGLPSVAIRKVEVDKLVTYKEDTYMNISSYGYMNEEESKLVYDDVSILVQRPRLNHKRFQVRVHAKSEVAQSVVVKFFLAPKYDSNEVEIPLHLNTENFFLLDVFKYDLPQGDSIIKRDSIENTLTSIDWPSAAKVAQKAKEALDGQGQFILESSRLEMFPHRLLLPKGREGGMPFVFLVHISEYHSPNVHHEPDIKLSGFHGFSSDDIINYDIGFPLDRPLHSWQIKNLHNIVVQDVLIYHKEKL